MIMEMIKPPKSSPSASSLPTHMLAEKKVKPSMIMNIVTMPRRA